MQHGGTGGGRPRTFDPDEIVDQAIELFWARGIASTTTREIEAVLGLSQSSLYNAFGSKKGLAARALERYEEQMDRELLDPLANAADGLASIDRFLADLLDWITDELHLGCMLINFFAEAGPTDREVQQRAATYRLRLRHLLASAIGREPGLDPDALSRADLLASSVLGLNLAARCGASASELMGTATATRAQVAAWAAADRAG